DGRWWYESLSGAAPSAWMIDALADAVSTRPCEVLWEDADRDAHRRGVSACLDAIAAGEVYQACVCTQFRGRVTGSPADFFVDG
ncbi:aminodeoxychorismate synthase component I, partial [Mycolicibacterium elephantis]